MPSRNETHDEQFERIWGHKPCWADPEGFERRVKEAEIALGVKQTDPCSNCNADHCDDEELRLCVGCLRHPDVVEKAKEATQKEASNGV